FHDQFTADDGVKFSFTRGLRVVTAKLVQDRRAGGGALLGTGSTRVACGLFAFVTTQQLDDLLAHATEVRAELAKNLSGNTFAFADQAKQNVLGADVVVAKLQRLTEAELKDLLGAGREGDVAGRGV